MKLFLVLIFCLLSLPGFGQEDDDATIETIETERRSQAEAAVKINEVSEELKKEISQIPTELKNLGHKTVNAKTLFDEKAVKLLKKTLENNPLVHSSPEEVRKLILDKYKGKPVGKFLADSPRILELFVDILRDKKALPSLIGVFSKKEDLKLYMYIWIGILIGTWLFKKYVVKKKSFLKTIMISLLTSAISLLIFYSMFFDELSPTVEIIARHIKI